MTSTQSNQPVDIPTADGLTLQAELSVPETVTAAAVLCHPHPLYGGNMHNNVVDALQRRLLTTGTACLRFNFRGVDGSEGTHGDGVAERHDIAGAVAVLSEQDPGVPLVLAGYSFGADVALSVSEPGVSAWFAVAPPLRVVPIKEMAAASDPRPKVIISGTNDDFRPPNQVREIVQGWTETTVAEAEGASHFFAVGLDAVADAAQALVEQLTA